MVLGIVIDSDKGQLRLLTDKLSCLRQLLEEWGGGGWDKKACVPHRPAEPRMQGGAVGHVIPPEDSRPLTCSALPTKVNTAFRSDLILWKTVLLD